MQNQSIKRAQEVERYQREFIENLEKLSDGKLKDHDDWLLHLRNLPESAQSILGDIHERLGWIEEDADKIPGKSPEYQTNLIQNIKSRVQSVHEICHRVNSILWFICQELSMEDFMDLNSLIYCYKQLKESGITTITLNQ
ncbi:MAG: hypothetical protein KF870_07370 [Leadbetterella sp.]|nr:hypothetical protein [Leadbetterella sp.]